MSELAPFKDKYKNEKIVLFAPGPTLNEFSYELYPKLKTYHKCTVNGGILHEEIRKELDIFIWAGDIDIPEHPTPSYNFIMEVIPTLEKNILKFVNCWTNNSITGIPGMSQTQISPKKAKELGFVRYNQKHRKKNFDKDLSSINSGPSSHTVAFHALQILLYMGFNEIILVGFDCGGGSHSYKKYDKYKDDICDWVEKNGINNDLINEWKKMEKWIGKEYTDVNVKVVNPVGLKGIFKCLN